MENLSIRDSSRYVIASALFQADANSRAPLVKITPDIFYQYLDNPRIGERVRASLEKISTDSVDGVLKNNPPHRLATEHVLASRAQELDALGSINIALLTAIELGEPAQRGNKDAIYKLEEKLTNAFRAIDLAPCSANERMQFSTELKTSFSDVINNGILAQEMIKNAQLAWTQQLWKDKVAEYTAPAPTLPKSDEHDFGM